MAKLLLIKTGKLNFFLTLIASFFLFTTGWGQTVTTDRDDYSPGMYVIVTGTGWEPGETISFDFHETPKVCTSDHHYRTTVANSEGNILYDQFLINDRHLGVSFLLTATGLSSGMKAVTYFTDGNVRIKVIGSSSKIKWIEYSNSNCSGNITDQNLLGESVTDKNNTTFSRLNGSPKSLKIEAFAEDSEGRMFQSWTGPEGDFSIDPTNPRIICIPGNFNNGVQEFIINYISCIDPTATISSSDSDNTICDGDSITFTAGVVTGATYEFFVNGTSTGAPSTTRTFTTSTLTNGQTVTVKVTTGACSATSAGITTIVNSIPSAPVVTVVDNCNGTSTLSTDTAGTLAWSNGKSSPSITVSTAGTYSVTTTVNGCTSEAGYGTAAPKTSPDKPTIIGAPSSTVCPGSSVVLTSSSTSGNQWFRNDILIANENAQTYTASQSGSYTVVVTANGCPSAVSEPVLVTVEDNVAPVATAQDITVQLDANGNATITAADIDNGSNDACGIASLAVSQTAFTCANVGPNTVTLTVTDNNGNVSTATAVVTVEDNVAPVATAQDITVQLDANGNATITAADIDNGSNDACGIASLAVSQTAFTCANVGPNTVTLTVTDNNGNVSTATAVVTVEDNVAPVATAQDITVQLDANGNATITAADIDNGSNDACGIASLAVSQTAFTCANVGPNTVTLTVTDNNGNVSTATAVVTVEDNVAPVATAQDITVQLDANGNATITAADIDNGSNDACGIASLAVSQTAFTCANVGPNTVTLTVTDNNGNVSTATAVVTVEDNVAPVATAQDITVQLDANGNATITAEDIDNGSNDACGIASLAVSQTAFTCANVGPNTVTLTVTDNNGNVSTATAVVTVEDNVAPVATAQDITVQLDANGNATITAADIDNGSNDACGIASLAVSQTAFTCANVGPNTVTLTVTDNNGNVSTATAVVTVEDNVAPVATAQDITVQLDANGNATITAADIDHGSNDACGIASLAVSQTAFTCANVGPNTVTLTVTDNNGNVSTATAVVTVEDNVAPVATAQDITVQLDANGNATITAADIDNGSNDACGIASLAVSQTAFTCANVGPNTVTLTVTDNNGNVSTATAVVTVEDNVAPVATAQDITVQLDANGNATITAEDIDNGSNDACGIASLAVSQTAFTCANVGPNTVTLTVTDNNGNVSTATAVVTVEDNVAPVATAQDITVQLDANGNATITAADIDNGSNDACGIASLAVSQTAFTCANVGPNTVTLTVTDNNGNVSTATAVVTVEDNVAPVATAQDITVQLDANGNATITAADIDHGSNDACGIASLAVSQTAFTCANVGPNTVTLTVTDNNGNVSTATAVVTVEDNVAPVATAQDITVQLDANGNATITAADIDNGSNDACGIASLAVSQTAFTCANVGPNTVTLTVTDNNGNVSTATAVVTVEDNVAPVATAQDITVQLDANGNATITAADIDNGSNDACGIASLAVSQTAFTCANVGPNTVTLTVTDNNGNVSTATAVVTVEDNVAPVATAQDITVQLDANGNATITAADIDNGSNDACGIASLAVSQTAFTCANVGPNTVTLTVTDNNGNVSTATAVVTVEDNVAPVATAQDITVQLDANGNATITAEDIDNGSNDACGIASLAVSQTAFTCANVGPNTVTLTVTDNNGNVSTATAVVTVEDNVAPVATAQDITVQLDANGNATITAADIDNGSNDACGIASLAVSQTAFTCANVGPNTVTLTVTDNNGNVSTATAVVTVEDNVAPVATAQDITVQLDANGNATITAADIDNGSNDACGIASLAVSQTAFTCANVGPNTVTLTVTDNNGNVSTATAVVTVEDNVAPVATAQDITVQLDANGNAIITAADIDNGSNDACGIASLAVSQTAFTCANVGPNTVTLTVTDNNGNVSTATAVVTVEDKIKPIITHSAQNSTVESDGQGNTQEYEEWLVNYGGAAATDNCGMVNWTHEITSSNNECGETGSTVVTFSATDASGNVNTTFATFTIEDTTAPELGNIVPINPVAVNTNFTLTAPGSDLNGVTSATWYFNSNGDATTTSQQVAPTSQSISENSVSATFNFGTNETGVYSVLLVVEDACGNKSEVIYEYVVIYDPSGGFVTGGGWIYSQPGSMPGKPNAEGKANFGFNAKYKTGKNNLTEVDGNTNFQFKEGDFHFKSISHENMSLVISGSHKATYRGVGTVNGTGSHYFIVTVIDGDASGGGGSDKFRITVFPNASTSPSGQPIYDNEYGVAANADASTVIDGGSIVIHKPKSNNKSAEVVEKTVAVEEGVELTNVEILSSLAVAPNPVRTDGVVRFSLVEDASVNISVFDFSGREVGRLFSGNVKANQVQDVDFSRRNLPSGVYIVKLTTDRGNSYDRQIILE